MLHLVKTFCSNSNTKLSHDIVLSWWIFRSKINSCKCIKLLGFLLKSDLTEFYFIPILCKWCLPLPPSLPAICVSDLSHTLNKLIKIPHIFYFLLLAEILQHICRRKCLQERMNQSLLQIRISRSTKKIPGLDRKNYSFYLC